MYTGIDILLGKIPNNYDEIQGRTFFPQPQLSRASSMFSTKSSVDYYERMEYNNNLNKDVKIDNNSNNLRLSCKTFQEKAIYVSKAPDPLNNTLNKHVTIECPTLSPPHVQTVHSTSGSSHSDNTVINIQLLYDPNTPIKPNFWDGNFHPISLHSSMKHLVLDSKNIKDSLNFMAKYISNKQVSSSKSNDFEDFYGIGKAIWNFISFVYQTNWDSLNTDKYSNTLRQKISAKFTPKVLFVPNSITNKILTGCDT